MESFKKRRLSNDVKKSPERCFHIESLIVTDFKERPGCETTCFVFLRTMSHRFDWCVLCYVGLRQSGGI